MPEGNQRWSVPPRRFGASVGLGVIGTFVICGGIGMWNLIVGAIGLAIIACAIGIYTISAVNSRVFRYVKGTGHVVSASQPPANSTQGRCNLQLLVRAPNINSVAVKTRDLHVPVAKWPDAGTDLPIMVAVGDARRVRVLWDEVAAHGSEAADDLRVRQGAAPDIESIDDESIDDMDDTGAAMGSGDAEFDPDFDSDLMDPTDIASEPLNFGLEDLDPDFGGTGPRHAAGSPRDLEEELVPVGVSESAGRRTIELDVRDPNVVRWSSDVDTEARVPLADPISEPIIEPIVEPATEWRAPSTAPVAEPISKPISEPAFEPVVDSVAESVAPPTRLPRRRPSPRARMSNVSPPPPPVAPPAPASPTSSDDSEPFDGPTRFDEDASFDEPSAADVTSPSDVRPPFEWPMPADMRSSVDTSPTADAPRTIDVPIPVDLRPPADVRSPVDTAPEVDESPADSSLASDAASAPDRTGTFAASGGFDPPSMFDVPRGFDAPRRSDAARGFDTPSAFASAPASDAPPASSPASPFGVPEDDDSDSIDEPSLAMPVLPHIDPSEIVGLSFADPPAPVMTELLINERLTNAPLINEPLVDDSPTTPLAFNQARVVSPAVAALPDLDDGPFDQANSESGAVSDAYLAAAPPPGSGRPSSPGNGRIKSVAATMFVTELSRSIIFYRDVLGFTETDAGRGSAVLESGDARIVLRRVAMAPVDRRLVQLLLEVPDIDAAYADLRNRNVSFIHRPRKVGQYEQMTLWSAALRDPDGHAIAITQWRPRTD